MKAVGRQNAWFSFKGIRNDSLDVRLLSMPVRPHPARKGTLKSIPGKDGKLFLDEGTYDNILVSIRCLTGSNENIDTVSEWLSGSGDLVFGDEPDRAYHARITKEYSRSNRNPRLRGQEFTVVFDCEPFRYESTPTGPVILSSAGGIINPGTVYARPLIRVNCSGSGSLMIGAQTMFFTAVPSYVNVDCDAKIVLIGTGTPSDPLLIATQYVSGEWFEIEPGYQAVSFTGDISSVSIVPRWRWL